MSYFEAYAHLMNKGFKQSELDKMTLKQVRQLAEKNK